MRSYNPTICLKSVSFFGNFTKLRYSDRPHLQKLFRKKKRIVHAETLVNSSAQLNVQPEQKKTQASQNQQLHKYLRPSILALTRIVISFIPHRLTNLFKNAVRYTKFPPKSLFLFTIFVPYTLLQPNILNYGLDKVSIEHRTTPIVWSLLRSRATFHILVHILQRPEIIHKDISGESPSERFK